MDSCLSIWLRHVCSKTFEGWRRDVKGKASERGKDRKISTQKIPVQPNLSKQLTKCMICKTTHGISHMILFLKASKFHTGYFWHSCSRSKFFSGICFCTYICAMWGPSEAFAQSVVKTKWFSTFCCWRWSSSLVQLACGYYGLRRTRLRAQNHALTP